MPKTRKSIDERLQELKRKKEELEKQLSATEKQKKKTDRKIDTRRKIIVGGAVMAHAQIDPDFGRALQTALQKAVAGKDKPLIADLLGASQSAQAGSGTGGNNAAPEQNRSAEPPMPNRSGRPGPQPPGKTPPTP